MTVLILGLILFLGVHSLRIVGDGPRTALIGRLGETPYKIAYSVLSMAGLMLIGNGYGRAFGEAGQLWAPPAGMRHLALLFVPVAFVLVAAAYAPAGRIKAAVGHPMVLGIALWALAHLLANGAVASAVLFGAFFVWAGLDYVACRARDRREGIVRRSLGSRGDVLAVVAGLGAALVFLLWLHLLLIGVSPLG